MQVLLACYLRASPPTCFRSTLWLHRVHILRHYAVLIYAIGIRTRTPARNKQEAARSRSVAVFNSKTHSSFSTLSSNGSSFLPGVNLCLFGHKIYSLLSTSNFIAMYSAQSSAIATCCIVFPILAILATVLRVYVQHSRSSRTLKLDDFVLFGALVCLLHGHSDVCIGWHTDSPRSLPLARAQ